MKRVLFAITGTVAGVVAMLGFKSHGTPVGLAGGLSSVGTGQAGAGPSSSSPPTHTPTHKHATQGNSASSGPTKPSPTGTPRTVTGKAEQTPYGVVQVKVSATGTKITNVSFVQLTAYDARSQMINQAVAPMLVKETLQAQSAKIDGISGASYTSAGYIASLQSALDQL